MIRIGIDLGGTNIAVGAVDDGHAIVSRVSVPTLARRPAAEVVGDMGDAVEAALEKAGLSIGDCRSIGIGSPGTCNSAAGVVERAYNLGWDHVPVCRMLEERFHVPCRLSNDANCAALAEQVAGAAVGHDNVVLITLGTGVGGGISRQGERLLAPVRRYVEKNCFGGKDGAIPIIAAARLGNDAGIIGAAAL